MSGAFRTGEIGRLKIIALGAERPAWGTQAQTGVVLRCVLKVLLATRSVLSMLSSL